MRLGRPAFQLLNELSAEEWLLWRAYDEMSPISDWRGDVQASLVASAVYQSQGAKVSVSDCLPQWQAQKQAEPGEADSASADATAALYAFLVAKAQMSSQANPAP